MPQVLLRGNPRVWRGLYERPFILKVLNLFTPNTQQSFLLSSRFKSVSQHKPIVSLDPPDGPLGI